MIEDEKYAYRTSIRINNNIKDIIEKQEEKSGVQWEPLMVMDETVFDVAEFTK